jgi:hypothetical protein
MGSPPNFDAGHGFADRLLFRLKARGEHVKAAENRSRDQAKYKQ